MRAPSSLGETASVHPDSELVQRALDDDGEALAALVDRLTPVVQARVARSLLRRRSDLDPSVGRALLEDLTQEVFLALFEHDGRALRRWDPERGASLENFVGLVAERKTISSLRRGQGRAEDELDDEDEPTLPTPEANPERRAVSRRLLRGLVEHFRAELSPRGWTLFEMLFIWEGTVGEVSRDLGMSTEAVRKWRTRLRAAARRWTAQQQGGEGLG